jgi:hypothetical protein
MLYDEGHTLAGVKRYWTRRGRVTSKQGSRKDVSQRVRGDLQAILRILDSHSK